MTSAELLVKVGQPAGQPTSLRMESLDGNACDVHGWHIFSL